MEQTEVCSPFVASSSARRALTPGALTPWSPSAAGSPGSSVEQRGPPSTEAMVTIIKSKCYPNYRFGNVGLCV